MKIAVAGTGHVRLSNYDFVIIANRVLPHLEDVSHTIYTRDLFDLD